MVVLNRVPSWRPKVSMTQHPLVNSMVEILTQDPTNSGFRLSWKFYFVPGDHVFKNVLVNFGANFLAGTVISFICCLGISYGELEVVISVFFF